jgi:DNA-binding protein HU-beta
MSMTKADLVDHVARKAHLTRKASKDAVDAMFEGIANALKKGDKAVITGFGTFSVRKRAPRPGRNPQTGAQIHITARKTPGFTAGKTLKRSVR